MKKIILLILFIYCSPVLSFSQRNAKWIQGYNPYGIPSGFNDLFQIDFSTQSPTFSILDTTAFASLVSNATICDTTGNLLFYTNGLAIMNSEHDTMLNGDYLCPNAYDYFTLNGAFGIYSVQSVLILPFPGSPNLYYLIHQGYYSDDLSAFPYPLYYCDTLYYSIIDMTLDNGKGAVVSKNQHLWVGSLPLRQLASIGSLTACKHANGRDWWIVSHRDSSSEFMSFLLTPQGISGPFYQNIGSLCLEFKGQSTFSPDGTKYAFFQYGASRIHLFDFDRCTGLFSNYINITNINAIHYGSIGVAFSPNSRFLYASCRDKIAQYDTYSSNISSSKIVVAFTDTVFPCPNYIVHFYLMQNSPDGKIYVSSDNSSFCMSVISDPDSLGLSCNALPHGFPLPRSNAYSVPNHPNYELGALSGSTCDSLTTLNEHFTTQSKIKISPNPTKGDFNISYQSNGNKVEVLEILDLFGEIIYHTTLPPWTTIHKVKLNESVKNGMYVCRITSTTGVSMGKFIIER